MSNKIKTIPFHRVKDQYEASVLYSVGCTIDSTEVIGFDMYFIFEDAGKCQDLIEKYHLHKLKGDLKSFEEALRTIKSLIHRK